jgi:mono/diheme cytochrome c family protein
MVGSTRQAVKGLLVALSLLVPGTSCDGKIGTTDRGGSTAPPIIPVPMPDGGTAMPLTGQAIFAGGCAPCHGADGQGTALGYELQHPVRAFATWVVRNGAPGVGFPNRMAAYAESLVSEQQLTEIWNYLAAIPQPTTGESLYLDYCANCHGADARGGAVGKDISDKGGADLLDKVRSGAGGTNYAARTRYMPGWSDLELTDAEVALIGQHIATLR